MNYSEDNLKTILELLQLRLRAYISSFSVTGRTENSIKTEMENEMKGSVIGANYLINALNGRGAGKIPFNFDKIIYQWMMNKGVRPHLTNKYTTPMEIARAIAWNIQKHGNIKARKRSEGLMRLVDQWIKTDLYRWANERHYEIIRKQIMDT